MDCLTEFSINLISNFYYYYDTATEKLSAGCRRHGTGGAYGRVTAWNATHLTYEHVQNNGGDVTDTFTLIQENHGPFPKYGEEVAAW